MSQLVAYTGPDTQSNNQLRTQQSSRSPAYDPVDKLRVSQPQALIDTDFEYGVQPTKWESISLQNNRQGTYYIPQQPTQIVANNPTTAGIQTTSGSKIVRVYIASTSSFTKDVTPIFVIGTTNANANGWWMPNNVQATYIEYAMTTAAATTENIFNPAQTFLYVGYYYSNCGFQVAANCVTNSGTTCTVTTTGPHGLNVGDYIYLTGLTATTFAPNGAWIVATTADTRTFTFTVNDAPTGTITNSAGNSILYTRPAGAVEARPYDGGVAFSAGGQITNQQLIRQTRRYFRYQSGKGLQFSTGSSLCPALFSPALTAGGASNRTITVTTPFPHNLSAGTTIKVAGVDQSGYNGTWTINSTSLTRTSFTYTVPLLGAPTVTTATGLTVRVSPIIWYGAANRIGMFDQQNGIFFEYDGVTLSAVVRNSTNQINGRVQVTQGSGRVSGVGTQFSTQLTVGTFIVIRGQTYRVVSILSDTVMYISPEYRGLTYDATNNPNGGYFVSVTSETKIPQSQWFDPMDGTGPSGYSIDLTRMQMFYIDYSWYGAGSIRWGFRGQSGAVTYCHQVQNNNVQFEAYMRSGNMCSHYESNGIQPTTQLTADLLSTEVNTINVTDTSRFNTSGTVTVRAPGSGSYTAGAIEVITYTGKTATTLTGLTRGVTGGSAATTFTYSATAPISVEYGTSDSVPSLSHWGSSVIMDGQFNDDKSLVFNYGMVNPLATSAVGNYALLAIRIAPAVDNGFTGTLGQREIINRMQLQLESLAVVSTGNTYLINLVLNGRLGAAFSGAGSQATFVTPQQIAGGISSSLAQVANNGSTGTTALIQGGESVAAAYVQLGGVTTLDLSQVRDIGNSILGGGTSNNVPTSQADFYPDGPDILYVVATPISATAGTIQARLSWKEAQA